MVGTLSQRHVYGCQQFSSALTIQTTVSRFATIKTFFDFLMTRRKDNLFMPHRIITRNKNYYENFAIAIPPTRTHFAKFCLNQFDEWQI